MNLHDWLSYIADIHTKPMDLGLERIAAVAARLDVLSVDCPVMTVTGTNGKGSTVAALEQCYLAGGFKVGVFTSPHLWRINEEIRINGQEIADAELCAAFKKIEQARADTTLTLFEFMTLSALVLFQAARLDVVILEVGLGGRLDAVNIIDADIAIMTSIGLDHQAWLGDTRAAIAVEKAGIFRKHRPAVCGDSLPPSELIAYAAHLPCPLYQIQIDYDYYQGDELTWSWQSPSSHYSGLPIPNIELSNAATALMAIALMQDKLPLSETAIRRALKRVALPGRYQILTHPIVQIFDVCHNPHAASNLADKLARTKTQFGRTEAVFSMLADKDIQATIDCLKPVVDTWHIAALPVARAATLPQLQAAFVACGVSRVLCYADIQAAYQTALANADADSRLVILGSFHTVAATLKPTVRL